MFALDRHSDRHVWSLVDYDVTYLHIDYRFAFDCSASGAHGLHVTIDTPFVLRRDGAELAINAEFVAQVAPALTILHQPARSFTVFRSGALLFTFGDGSSIEVPKHTQYESWSLRGHGELSSLDLLCSPHEGVPWNQLTS